MTEIPIVSVVGIPKLDGSTEWWELTDGWHLKKVDPSYNEMATDAEVAVAISTHADLTDAHHPEVHSHPTHGDINFTGTISADGEAGLTGTKTIGGYKFTFTKGLLTGFEPV